MYVEIFRLTHRSSMTTSKYQNDEYQEKSKFTGYPRICLLKQRIHFTKIIKSYKHT